MMNRAHGFGGGSSRIHDYRLRKPSCIRSTAPRARVLTLVWGDSRCTPAPAGADILGTSHPPGKGHIGRKPNRDPIRCGANDGMSGRGRDRDASGWRLGLGPCALFQDYKT